jgi:hypothetical protein
MESFVALFVIVGCLVVLDLLAGRFGADSRPAYRDDWARSAAN